MLTGLKNVLAVSFLDLARENSILANELEAALNARGESIPSEMVAAPLGTVPMVLAVLDQARLDEVVELMSLSSSATLALRALRRPEALVSAALQTLVSNGDLTAVEAEKAALVLERYLLCGDDVGVFNSVERASGELTNAQLAGWAPARWLAELTANEAEPPQGETLERLAEILARRFEVLYPGPAWLGRLAPYDAGSAEQDLDTISVLEARNPRRFDGGFTSLRLDDVDPVDPDIEAAWSRLAHVVRGYPGLGIAEIFDDYSVDVTSRSTRAQTRIGLLTSSIASAADNRPRHDLLALDLSTGSKEWVRWQVASMDPDHRDHVIESVRAFQRLRTIAGDLDSAVAVMHGGYSTVRQIASTPLATFSDAVALGEAGGPRIWAAARRLGTDAALYVAGISDQLGAAADPAATQPPPSVVQTFTELDGYASLFGNQSFCDCSHCASILGPAAYFVDLMELVKHEVGDQMPSGHRLALATRRPDLWTTPLTCAATTELVPTLSIVNEVLENDLARRTGYSGSWSDRAAIEALVYQTVLPGRTSSFVQPFAVGLARASMALSAFGVSRPALAEATGASGGASRRIALGISPAWETLVTARRLTLPALSEVYGLTFVGSATTVERVDATELAAAMGVDRTTLGTLLSAWFVVRPGVTPPLIVAARRSPDSIQNDMEWVEGLTADVLDRMHRLARAAAVLGISAAALDRRLRAATDDLLDTASLDRFAAVAWLAAELGSSFNEDDAVALGGAADQAIFDHRFNRGVRAGVGAWPDPATRLWHPGLGTGGAAPGDGATSRLTAGLGLGDAATLTLIRHVAPLLTRESGATFDPDAPDPAERYFVLSAANLAVLDRHARLARLLGISVDELVQLSTIADLAGVLDSNGAVAVVRARRAWRASGRTLDQLQIAVGHWPRNPVAGFDPLAAAGAIRDGALPALAIDDTLFATALGISTAASSDVLAANPAWFTQVGGYRLIAPEIDAATAPIVVPPSATHPDGRAVEPDELRAVLSTRTMRTRIVRILGTATQRSDDDILALLALARQDVTSDIVAGVLFPGTPSNLDALITTVQRLAVATRGWIAPALMFLVANPAQFGEGDWPSLGPTSADPTDAWFSFEQAVALGRAAPRSEVAELHQNIIALVSAFDPVTRSFSEDADSTLVWLLKSDAATVASLRAFPLPAGAIAALDRVGRLTGLCRTLGIDGQVLQTLASDADADRVRGADAIEHAAASRAESQPGVAARLEQIRQRTREQCRDALVDHLLRSLITPEFRDVVALANHFLIDVAAGGCATTSRVVAATNAVQEYITRITLGLERDDLLPSDPAHVGVVLSAAGRASWEWRRAYRVWEANRKVFLWPENYLDPSLRDDKTPLFARLEEALAQSALDEASILGAYAAYLRELDELASLRIAGAYHDIGVDADGAAKDVLHLIGVTDADPLAFYYRSVTDLIISDRLLDRGVVWSGWHKLDLSIASRTVSPVIHQGRMHLLWGTVRTRAKQSLITGQMDFGGYQHTLSLSMLTQQPTGQWGGPQDVTIPAPTYRTLFHPLPGLLTDRRGTDGKVYYDPSGTEHEEPRESYTLVGAPWLGVWPSVHGDVLRVCYRAFAGNGDLDPYTRVLSSQESNAPRPVRPYIGVEGLTISGGTPISQFLAPTALGNVLADRGNLALYAREWDSATGSVILAHAQPVYDGLLATAHRRPDALAIGGSPGDAIVRIGTDLLYLRSPHEGSPRHAIRRLGTTVTRGLGRVLFERGLDGLLATAHQLALAEAALPMTIQPGALTDKSDAGTVNFRGPFGTYLRELFFHVPLLVATSLAARGRYADARRWFHRVFDPTSTEVVDTTGVPPEDVAHRQLDRVWRYRELRGLTPERAREILSDGAALAAYREDPFNPHAIARRRLTAYQRHAFGRYVDNLLDWGDSLFAQFTRETVEEARLLYQLASELLGARPARLGDCEPGGANPFDYEHIEPLLGQSGEICESVATDLLGVRADTLAHDRGNGPVAPSEVLSFALERFPLRPTAPSSRPVSLARQWLAGRIGTWAPAKGVGIGDGSLGLGGQVGAPARGEIDGDSLADSLLAQLGPVFCVPVNKALLARWDRVEDRLWKIRHCLDLDGNRRELALFAPELDPMSRVTATALGLAPEDLIPELARDVPPYRFAYLIERAKGYAGALASFGSALLGALERRDNEALSRLRQEQGLALARATRRQRELDLDVAREALAGAEAQITAAEHRRDYYDELLSTGRDAFERSEIASRLGALALRGLSLAGHMSASIAKLLPEFNAPWTVSYGGVEVGGAAESTGNTYAEAATLLDAGGGLFGLVGSHARRERDWKQQLVAVRDDLAVLQRQRAVSSLRVRLAERSLVLHDESVAQLEEVLAFERDRVTNLALHTRLADALKRLHRVAYGHALALARLAERAYRYERGDDASGLAGGYWDASMGGLLAGEGLLSDLNALDRRFLESNHRELEIDQPVPLSQIDPAALLTLRETGACEFAIPETVFDLAYPGHWRRRLRAVRLTMPCVTGPYQNVSATLSLLESRVRTSPSGDLEPVPLAHSTTIAASSAQADGGMFELSFRDERYLPFEGQGAVSSWRLELPRTVRGFDYASISDVIVSLAYSARPDAARRAVLESPATVAGSLLRHHQEHATLRIVSARQDLGASFARLLRTPPGTPVSFALSEDMVPPIFRRRPIEVLTSVFAGMPAGVALRLAPGVTPTGFVLEIDGLAVNGFQAELGLGGMWFAEVAWPTTMAWPGSHSLTVSDAGALAGADALDPDKVLDVSLVLPIRLGVGA